MQLLVMLDSLSTIQWVRMEFYIADLDIKLIVN